MPGFGRPRGGFNGGSNRRAGRPGGFGGMHHPPHGHRPPPPHRHYGRYRGGCLGCLLPVISMVCIVIVGIALLL